ncbi:MAG: nitrilase-related carbon-nitrogen hydrolase [Desulfobacteraceae bacterium]
MSKIRVAAACMFSQPGAWERNMESLDALAGRASEEGAQIVCFPELSLSGYVLDHPESMASAEKTRQAIVFIEELAMRRGLVVLAGFVEHSAGRPYISHLAAGPGGVMGVYRKTHLSPAEEAGYRAGESFPLFGDNGIRFGLQLCYESHFPEISTIMALRGAEVLFIPHASPRGTPQEKLRSWLRHLPARAFDNGVYVVACNQAGLIQGGLSFPPAAVVVDPGGRVTASYAAAGENLLVASLDLDLLQEVRSHRMKYFLPRRRPELYGPLACTEA